MGIHTLIAERITALIEFSGNMLRFLTVSLAVISAVSSDQMMKKIHKDMMVMNSMTACWGKGNMVYFKVALKQAMEQCGHSSGPANLLKPANPFAQLIQGNSDANTLPFPMNRNKRQAEGLLQPTEEDFKEFLMDFEDFKGDVA